MNLSKPQQVKLTFKLMAIATLDGEPLQKVLEQLERDFAEYVEVIRPMVYLAPDFVIAKLKEQFPALADAMSNPKAVVVVRKIQDYLIRKGVSNVAVQ